MIRQPLLLYFAELQAAFKVSFADRQTTAFQILGILFNNGFAVVLWIMFFKKFQSFSGWELPDISLLLGMLGVTIGIAGVVFGGYSDIASSISTREIDSYLTQPSRILPRILVRRCLATSCGDFLTGAFLLTTVANLHWGNVIAVVVALIVCQVIFVSAAVTYGSLAFFTVAGPGVARELLAMLGLLSTFPPGVYAGLAKLIIYTVLPAGFITLLPVSYVRNPTFLKMGALVTGSIIYAAIALFVFRCGLRRYVA